MSIVQAIRQRRRGVAVVVLAIPPGRAFEQNLETHRLEFNFVLGEQIASLGLEEGLVQFVDFTKDFMKDGQFNRTLFQDAVHFSNRGFEIFANRLEQMLSTQLK